MPIFSYFLVKEKLWFKLFYFFFEKIFVFILLNNQIVFLVFYFKTIFLKNILIFVNENYTGCLHVIAYFCMLLHVITCYCMLLHVKAVRVLVNSQTIVKYYVTSLIVLGT